MKRLITLSLFLLIVQLSSFGENYPEKIIIKGDTLVVITPQQLTTINCKLEYKNSLVKENAVLLSKINVKDSLNKIKDENFIKIVTNVKYQNDELNNRVNNLMVENNTLKKKNKDKNKRFWGTLVTSVVVGMVAGFMIAK